MNEGSDPALALWREGTQRLLAGELDEAIALFTRSLETRPTAEAYTFRGWAYSFAGRLDDAIVECHKAIATDPEFGNPYNDIGCYLMEQGRMDEAIPWFGRAKTAARYEPRHFPYLNLGRLRAGGPGGTPRRPDRPAPARDPPLQGQLTGLASGG